MSWPAPVILQGRHASLLPLDASHRDALADAARDGELWRLWYTSIPSPDGMAAEIERRLALQAAGRMLPFTVLDAGGTPVGMTTYMNVDAVHRRVEIGSTWYARRVQRTPLNTECKLLLLAHAFEGLGCKVVGLRTDNFNFRSQRAIEALGAKRDGVLRHHMQRSDGTVRDTVLYSILAAEWPDVRRHLELRLARHGARGD